MAITFRFRDERNLELAEVRDVLVRGASLTGFRGFDSEAVHDWFFERKTLEPFEAPRGARIGSVVVEGQLQGKRPYEEFREVFRRGMGTVGAFGTLGVRVGFEERDSRQSKRTADTAGVWVIRGVPHFSYTPNGSRVAKDPGHRRDFMRRLAEASLVPLAFRDEGASFRLEHATGGELWTSGGGLGGVNPSQLRIAMPERCAIELVDILAQFLDSFGSGKRFDYAWRAQPTFDGRPQHEMEEGPRILAQVVQAGFPAASYSIHVVFRLAEIEGIEILRALCGPKDEVLLTFCSFEWPRGNQVNLDVVTSAAGHRIEAECRLPVDAAEIGEPLGLQLSQVTQPNQ